MSRAFEIRPLIIAALIGIALLFIFQRRLKAIPLGALIGAGVQVGVRLAGVS